MRKLLLAGLATASLAALPAVPALAAKDRGDAPAASTSKRKCDPNYRGRCLRPGVSDYDCAGGSGNGPYYVSGPFRVVGSDRHRLDADGDGIACE
ncbi:excalibur calcium-binding domain-containing protein [Conexibacter woesei]|uniref:Excalibur domain protein n=1 Tax=Conexibacter woesei (strain DSM 14684 / CCUG 47730 / CIP 108061 / JCM 11494 / NBRC 100937 / ID131577) TaxID=469383 RepID=D3F3I0_CONWI|nr:excalibur calcium-binding domain-containing protein [Conexibacter woesei]ADB52345.1 Excalibur domain protein [Conexibacter woesei DSM 14684]